MPSSTYSDKQILIKRYILGKLPDDKKESFTEILMEDRELSEELKDVEYMIVEDYVADRLSAEERLAFEYYFSRVPHMVELVQFESAFQQYTHNLISESANATGALPVFAANPLPPEASPMKGRESSSYTGNTSPFWQLWVSVPGLAATGLILMLIPFAWKVVQLNSRLVALEEKNKELESKSEKLIAELEKRPIVTPTPTAFTQSTPDTKLPQELSVNEVANVKFSVEDWDRGDGAMGGQFSKKYQRLKLFASQKDVNFSPLPSLPSLGRTDIKTIFITIEPEGRQGVTPISLVADYDATKEVIKLPVVSAAKLADGKYRVRLRGVSRSEPDEKPVTIGSFYFQVTRRKK